MVKAEEACLKCFFDFVLFLKLKTGGFQSITNFTVDKQSTHTFEFLLPNNLNERYTSCFLVNEKGVVWGKVQTLLILDEDLSFQIAQQPENQERLDRMQTLDIVNGLFDGVGGCFSSFFFLIVWALFFFGILIVTSLQISTA